MVISDVTWLNNKTLRFVYDLILLYYHTIDIKLYSSSVRYTLADIAKMNKPNFRIGRIELLRIPGPLCAWVLLLHRALYRGFSIVAQREGRMHLCLIMFAQEYA